MKDTIFDIVKHTAGLGFIEQVKVTGSADETVLQAADTDRTVVLNAKKSKSFNKINTLAS